jgi:hypothetical protein
MSGDLITMKWPLPIFVGVVSLGMGLLTSSIFGWANKLQIRSLCVCVAIVVAVGYLMMLLPLSVLRSRWLALPLAIVSFSLPFVVKRFLIKPSRKA